MKNKASKLYKKALVLAQKDEPDFEEAYKLLCASYDLGNLKAAYALGTWYLFGRVVRKSYKKAIPYLVIAAQNKVSDACYDLAVCYEKGRGVKKDLKLAFQYYLRAALLGDKQAMRAVGRCMNYGIGIAKNVSIAKIYLETGDFLSKK